jgi:hypothetical protein
MKVNWLIEKDVFEDNHDKLVKEIKRQGMTAKVIDYIPFKYDSDHELRVACYKQYDPEDCVVFYGSLNFGRKLRKLPWVPGVYLNEKAFECTSYYPVLGDMLVHHNYIMLPYGDLIRMKDKIFNDYFKVHNKIFMRPNSGNKQFTGMVTEEWNYDENIKLAGFYNVEPDLLVLISNVWPLHQEWRFVVVDGKVVSGSLYRDWSSGEKRLGNITTKDYVLLHSHSLWENCDDTKAWEAAQLCANKYDPDRAWTIDVAKSVHGQYAILEIGCFSCAGLYGNNLEDVVKAVSASALKEWNEYRE